MPSAPTDHSRRLRNKSYKLDSDLARALNLVGEKWTLLIINELRDGPVRFRDLHLGLGISSEMLRVALHDMTHDNLIFRRRYREIPPRVDYELTALGLAVVPLIDLIAQWADAVIGVRMTSAAQA